MSDLTRPGVPARGPTGGVVPLRPLTAGELLDAAVALLRPRARLLLGLGALLAVAEQVVLYPLRSAADVDATLLPATGRLTPYAYSLIAGFATEAMIISLIAAVAARGGGTVLLGRAAPARPTARPGTVAVIVLLVGAVVAVTATPFLLLDSLQVLGFLVAWALVMLAWPLPYGLLGAAAPAVVIEGRGVGGALRRSLWLASRDGMRGAFLRVLGYSSWLVARLGLLGVLALMSLFSVGLPSSTWDRVMLAIAAGLVNAVAYPVLGCLDAMFLLEARMRAEGLDISLRWALRRGVAPTLAAPR